MGTNNFKWEELPPQQCFVHYHIRDRHPGIASDIPLEPGLPVALISMLIDSMAVVWHAGTGGRKGGKLSLFFLPRGFNLMERVSVTLLYFCHIPDIFLPLCFTSGQQP